MTTNPPRDDAPTDNEIWGFYEDEYPIYTNKAGAHPELGSLVTPEEVNRLVAKLREAKAAPTDAALVKALERIAAEEFVRVGYDQTDIDVQPVLTIDEMQQVARAALASRAAPPEAQVKGADDWTPETNILPWVFLTIDQMRRFENSTGELERLGLNGEWIATDTPLSPGLVYRIRPLALHVRGRRHD